MGCEIVAYLSCSAGRTHFIYLEEIALVSTNQVGKSIYISILFSYFIAIQHNKSVFYQIATEILLRGDKYCQQLPPHPLLLQDGIHIVCVYRVNMVKPQDALPNVKCRELSCLIFQSPKML